MSESQDQARPATCFGMPVADWKLLAVLVAGGLLFAAGLRVRQLFQTQQTQQIVAQLESAGLKSYLGEDGNLTGLLSNPSHPVDASRIPAVPLPHVSFILLENSKINDAQFAKLSLSSNLTALNLGGTRIGSPTIQRLSSTPDLHWLNLDSTAIFDSDLGLIGKLTALWSLTLDDTQITDDGLRFLSSCRTLQTLSLNRTRITDAGLVHLKELPQLQILSLAGTEVSDQGIPHLIQIRSLYSIQLAQSKVTRSGRRQLAGNFPQNILMRGGSLPAGGQPSRSEQVAETPE